MEAFPRREGTLTVFMPFLRILAKTFTKGLGTTTDGWCRDAIRIRGAPSRNRPTRGGFDVVEGNPSRPTRVNVYLFIWQMSPMVTARNPDRAVRPTQLHPTRGDSRQCLLVTQAGAHVFHVLASSP
jgi:hypothetical protein